MNITQKDIATFWAVRAEGPHGTVFWNIHKGWLPRPHEATQFATPEAAGRCVTRGKRYRWSGENIGVVEVKP